MQPPTDSTLDTATWNSISGAPGIRIHLEELLYSRGLTLAEFSRRIGVKDDNVRTLRDGGSKAIRFQNLETICRVLDCQPGDLFSFAPVKDDTAE